MDIEEPLIIPDPKKPESVQQCMAYIMHGRWGSDPDEDPGFIHFFQAALCHELNEETHHIDLPGITVGKSEDEDYFIVLYLVQKLCLLYDMEFDTPGRQIERMAEHNGKIIAAQESEQELATNLSLALDIGPLHRG